MISKNSQIVEKATAYKSGQFAFDAENKVLFCGEDTITLSPKVCELLGPLLENTGRVVSCDVLLGQVRAETFVEEATLTHHVSALRKTLSAKIKTTGNLSK